MIIDFPNDINSTFRMYLFCCYLFFCFKINKKKLFCKTKINIFPSSSSSKFHYCFWLFHKIHISSLLQNPNAKQLPDEHLAEENKEKTEDSDDDEDDGKDDLIDRLEDTISRISSTKVTGGDGQGGGCDKDETDKLLNIDFAEELNFRYNLLFF